MPAGHFPQHGGQVQGVGIVTKNTLAKPRLFCALRPQLGYPGFMIPCEHDAWAPNNSFFQHFISLFVGAVELCTTVNRSFEKIMQAYSRNADGVFQDVYPLLSVEPSHLFQRFQTRGYVEIVEITQLVCKRVNSFLLEQLLAFLPFFKSKKECAFHS